MHIKIKRLGIMIVVVVISVSTIGYLDFASAAVPGNNQRASLTSTGLQASGGNGLLSADGKSVVFSSSSNILPSGGGGVFKRNIDTGAVVRVNMSTSGVVSNSGITPLQVSATGRYVLFRSTASNLIDGATITSPVGQLYLRDTIAGVTTLITQNSSGVLSNGNWHEEIGVSSDGRFVAFTTKASNLSPDSTDGSPHMYMLDRFDNTLSIIDRKTDGSVGDTNSTWSPDGAMSCDGSMIVFHYPSNLIVGDMTYNPHVNVYVLDRRGDDVKITNITNAANYAATEPSISCNGDYVGFQSISTNLDPSVSTSYIYNAWRPYVFDRINGTYHSVAVTGGGSTTSAPTCGTFSDPGSECVKISDTGIATFAADDSTLTGNTGTNVYQKNIYSGNTELVSKNNSNVVGNGTSYFATVSADGRYIGFRSNASNLIAGDTNNASDYFRAQTGY